MGSAKGETYDFVSPLAIGAVHEDEGEAADTDGPGGCTQCMRRPFVRRYWKASASMAMIVIVCAISAFTGVGSAPETESRVRVRAKELDAWALPRAACGAPGVPIRFVLGEDNASAALVCVQGGLGWDAWATLGVTLSTLAALISGAPPDLAMLSATGIFRLADIVPAHDTWRGFSSPSIIALAELYVVAAAVRQVRLLSASRPPWRTG